MKKMLSILCAFLIPLSGPLPTALAATAAASKSDSQFPGLDADWKVKDGTLWIQLLSSRSPANQPMCGKWQAAACRAGDCAGGDKILKEAGPSVDIYCWDKDPKTKADIGTPSAYKLRIMQGKMMAVPSADSKKDFVPVRFGMIMGFKDTPVSAVTQSGTETGLLATALAKIKSFIPGKKPAVPTPQPETPLAAKPDVPDQTPANPDPKAGYMKDWIDILPFPPNTRQSLCQAGQYPSCRSGDCGYKGKIYKKGIRAPIYCLFNHRQTTVSEYDAVLSSHELTFTQDPMHWTSRESWLNWIHHQRPGAYTAFPKPQKDAASKGVPVRLIPSFSAEGAKVVVHILDQSGTPTTPPEPGQTPPPATGTPSSDWDQALKKLFSNDVERAYIGYMAGKDPKLQDRLIEADKSQDPKAREAILADMKKDLNNLIDKAKYDLNKPQWLEIADPKLAAKLAKDGISPERLLQYFCSNVWQGKPAAATAHPKLRPPTLSIHKKVEMQLENLTPLRDKFVKNLDEIGSTPENQKSAWDVAWDDTDPIGNRCRGIPDSQTQPPSNGSSQPPTTPPGNGSYHPEPPSTGTGEPSVTNKSNQSGTVDNSGLYKDIAGGAFGAVGFGLFGYAAFGPAGLVMGLFAGAVIGAAAVHINNKGLGK